MSAAWARLGTEGRVVAITTVAGLLALVPGVPSPLRGLAAVTFLLVAPGLAWAHTLPVDGLVERLAVAVALSLAIDVLVAEALLFAGLPGPLPAALVLTLITVGGLVQGAERPVEAAAWIAGLLVVVLLVAREVLRSTTPDSPAVRALGRMLVPAGIGLGLVMALRLAELVAGRA